MTLEEKAKDYTTNVVLHGKASIEEVEYAYKAGYNQAKQDIALSDKLVTVETLEENIRQFLEMRKANDALMEQMEKMKNCTNCKNNNGFGCTVTDDCENFCRWELEE